MAYKIEYSPETAHIYPQRKERKRMYYRKWVAALVLVAALLWLRLNGIPDFLVPGDPEVTKSAASALIVDLQEGVGVEDAVTAFCRTILEHAG